jgi:hypothetical protein
LLEVDKEFYNGALDTAEHPRCIDPSAPAFGRVARARVFSVVFFSEFLFLPIYRDKLTEGFANPFPTDLLPGGRGGVDDRKRKIDDEIAFLRVRLDLMTSIVARMRVATANREYDKMPGLKKEQDAAMGRFAA